MNVNKAIVVGRITNNLELKALPSGNAVLAFSLATNEYFTDASGQKQERVEFHNITAFGKTAENIAKYMSKGNQLFVEGKLQTRSWDDKDTGKKMYRTEIIAQNIQFGAKPQGQQGQRDGGYGNGVDDFDRQVDALSGGSSQVDDGGDINPEDIPF